MLYATSSQALQLPLMVLCGILIGAVSMLFSTLRLLICARFWLCLLSDILMGIIWAAIFCTSVTLASGGQLRLFHVLTAIAGTALFLSATVMPIHRTVAFISKTLHRLSNRISNHPLIKAICK